MSFCDSSLAPNLKDAATFINAIAPDGEVTFTPYPDNLSASGTKCFTGSLERYQNKLTRLNNQQLAIGILVNQGDGKGAKSQNIQSVRALFADFDEAQRANIPKQWPLEPHLLVESSAGNMHAYWLVDNCPLERFQPLQKAIAASLGSDPSISNPNRIMRLAGFWHQKQKNGKCTPFQSRLVHHHETQKYTLDEVIDGLSLTLSPSPDQADALLALPSRSTRYDGDIHEGGRHDFITKQARHLKGIGVSGQALKESLTSINQNRCQPPLANAEMAKIIQWADSTVGFDNESPLELESSPKLRLGDWTLSRYQGQPPEKKWMVDGFIPAHSVGMVAAGGGLGKSFLCLDFVFKTAMHNTQQLQSMQPPPQTMGGTLRQGGKAVFITAEDSKDELHRRVHALKKAYKLNDSDIDEDRLIILPLAEIDGGLLVVTDGKNGIEVTPQYRRLKEQLCCLSDLALIVFDPLQSLVAGDINSGDSRTSSAFNQSMRELSASTGATVIITHHTSKGSASNPINSDNAHRHVMGNVQNTNGMRFVYAFWAVEEKRARRLCAQLDKPYRPDCIVEGKITKDNGGLNKTVQTFYRTDCGLLESVSSAVKWAI